MADQRERFRDRLIHLVISVPRVTLVVLALLTGFFAWLGSDLHIDFNLDSLFQSDHPSVIEYQEFVKEFGGGDDAVVLVALERRPSVLEPQVLARVGEFASTMREHSAVQSLTSISDFQQLFYLGRQRTDTQALIASLPVVRGVLLSADTSVGGILIQLKSEGISEETLDSFFAALHESSAQLEADLGARCHFAGVPVVNREYVRLIRGDLLRFTPISAISICLLLMIVFRDWRGVVLPLGAVGISIIWTMGIFAALGRTLGVLNCVVPNMILMIGIADAIHIFSRYREEADSQGPGPNSLRRAMKSMVSACLMTSFTTSIGFATLVVTTIFIVREFGVLAAGGIMLAYLVSMMFLPAMLTLFPGKAANRDPDTSRRLDRYLDGLAGWVERNARWVISVFAIFLTWAIVGVFMVPVRASWFQDIKTDNPVRLDNEWIEEHLGGVFTMELILTADEGRSWYEPAMLERIQTAQQKVESTALVASSTSLADLVTTVQDLAVFSMGGNPDGKLPPSEQRVRFALGAASSQLGEGVVDRFVTDDGRTARVAMRMIDPSSDRVDEFVQLQRDLNVAGAEISFTGKGLTAKQALDRTIEDMLFSVGLAAAIIFALMLFLFRSLMLGLLAMIPNAIPILSSMAVMGWMGIPLNFSTITIFSISLGIAVDDTIHALFRYRDELDRTGDYRSAIHGMLVGAGRPILYTTIVLILGFGSIVTSNFKFTVHFGMLGTVTIVSALVADLLLLPALLYVFHPGRGAIEGVGVD